MKPVRQDPSSGKVVKTSERATGCCGVGLLSVAENTTERPPGPSAPPSLHQTSFLSWLSSDVLPASILQQMQKRETSSLLSAIRMQAFVLESNS